LDISKLQFFFKKGYFFSSVFGHQNPGSGLDPYPDSVEMLDPDPDLMNPDPQLWLKLKRTRSFQGSSKREQLNYSKS
jgi:hypothetical protein